MRRLIFTLPCLFLILDWLLPLSFPMAVALPAAVVMLAASQYYFWSRLSSGSMLNPELPRLLIIFFNWALGWIFTLTLLQICLDIAVLPVALAEWRPVFIPSVLREAAGLLAGLIAAVSVRSAIRVPPVRDVSITIPGLDLAFDGYRLIQLTDLHLSRLFTASWARKVVERTNAAGADLIVITGDFIDGPVSARAEAVAPLKNLTAPDGVLAIPGNHEYLSGYGSWIQHLSGLGLHLLLNAHETITRGEARLVIAGVTDLSAARHHEAPPDLAAALAGRPDNAAVVLLDHQPRNARAAPAYGVALQLSGHTHGGMVRGLDRIVARANNGFVSGRYSIGDMTLYVSNGTGLWPGFALRLGVPSEITRFHLLAG
ncbi:metallophosphoesterase [Acetobacter sp. AN02]|uniref:metallophosphoesterase n=1 Tax=Acetobacter sp. AN02 TaxID=2894186 RepID=UPI0024344C6B|nr:metallophosphoesterase [Acetobacter sp. AN02]MDG6094302.1 metallophosphoesterase [Acetobacter sp. AN02]